MREIKFRAWFDNRMLYNIQAGGFVGETAPTTYSRHTGWTNLDVNTPVMQYTGLKDKNGKEIYEGDIVERDDNSKGKWRRRCMISWVKSHYVLKGYWYDVNNPEKKNPIDFKFGAFIYEKDGELEVIGNIYENPDLLPKE